MKSLGNTAVTLRHSNGQLCHRANKWLLAMKTHNSHSLTHCGSPEKGWVLSSPVGPHLRSVSVARNAPRRLLMNRRSPLTFRCTPSWQNSEPLWRRACLQNVMPFSCWQRFHSVSFTLATELLYSASVNGIGNRVLGRRSNVADTVRVSTMHQSVLTEYNCSYVTKWL